MKKILFVLLIVFSSSAINAQNLKLNSPSVINMLDTVVFDLSQQVIQGNTVGFPVSFLSDDTINALDFSFKFNMVDFTYDTILDLTNYMTTLAFLHPDQHVRFTSYSFQTYTNDTALALVRFIINTGQQFCANDLDSIKIYLNGDPCALKVITCSPNGLEDMHNIENAVRVFPNPAHTTLTVEASKNATLILMDVDGREIIKKFYLSRESEHHLNIENIADGVYFLKVYADDFVTTKKVVIEN